MSRTSIAAVTDHITIRRNGLALDIEVDGHPLPTMAVSSIVVADSADDLAPYLTLTVHAARITFETSIDELEDDDGETEREAA